MTSVASVKKNKNLVVLSVWSDQFRISYSPVYNPPPPPPRGIKAHRHFFINVIRERCSKCIGFVCFVLGPVTVEINDQLTEIMACDAKVS